MFELPGHLDERAIRQEAILDDARGVSLTSILNRSSAITPGPRPASVIIKDDTIRSGANTPEVYATLEQKMRVAEALEAAGVVEVEAGYASIDEHITFIRELKRRGSPLRLSAHCDYYGARWQTTIERAIDAGVDIVNVVGMAGAIMPLGLHPDLSGAAVADQIFRVTQYAKERGAYVAIGSVAATLPDYDRWIRAALAGGADRFYIYDTRGWHTPPVMAYLTRFMRDIIGDQREIAIHCHDDFGMATANTVEAVAAGADVVDVTVLRTGHRCGNAALEQVVAALESIYGIHTGVRMEQLQALCMVVAREYGVTIAPNAPIVGKHMYTYGGVHVTALLGGNWFVWENIKAEAVGHTRNIVFGPTALQRTSSSPVLAKINQMGLTATDSDLDEILARLSALLARQREASVHEMERIITEVLAPA